MAKGCGTSCRAQEITQRRLNSTRCHFYLGLTVILQIHRQVRVLPIPYGTYDPRESLSEPLSPPLIPEQLVKRRACLFISTTSSCSHPSKRACLAVIMQSIKEKLVSPYRGSEKTYEMVREQLRDRYGDEVADEFDPKTDAMPFAAWIGYKFRVRKGEKALHSVTYVDVKDEETGEVVRKVKRPVFLFHRRQVERIV